ncbi:MAG: hypothetical protein A2055_00235 [Deltaproteobacteria bacterium GWA2_47_9]|nr:MAG: hypothetical protein A2055_00235 [Deltaproteobacteria bacterium GWA2_47_9]
MLSDSGTYYRFQTPEFIDIDVPGKLGRLYSMGFQITKAWYRQPLGGCRRPGTNGSTRTMYPGVLIVCLAKADDDIYLYDFTELQVKAIPCPYFVKVFITQTGS